MAKTRPKNKPIGCAPCPFKDCKLTGDVFRFRQWSENPKLTRKAGGLYMMCADHGMTQDQKWLAEHAKITDQDDSEAARSPVTDDPDTGEAKASPEKDDDNPWGFFK